MKLAAFDFDSTLMDGETIDILAKAYGVGDKVAQITERAMAGELDFRASLVERCATLKGMSVGLLREVCGSLGFIKGAAELIEELKLRGYAVVVFSGGFDEGLDFGKKELGFHSGFCNHLGRENGVLSGEVWGEMMNSDSKGRMLKKVQELYRIGQQDTFACGDGANDISLFSQASLKIAFCAKAKLQEAADVKINEKNLLRILDYLNDF